MCFDSPLIAHRTIFNHWAVKNTIRWREGIASKRSHALGGFVSKLITGGEIWFLKARNLSTCQHNDWTFGIYKQILTVSPLTGFIMFKKNENVKRITALRQALRALVLLFFIYLWELCKSYHLLDRYIFSWCSFTVGNLVFWDNIKRSNTLIYYDELLKKKKKTSLEFGL